MMERTAHYLKTVKGDAIPSQFMVVGLNTSESRHLALGNTWKSQLLSGTVITFRWRESKPSGRIVKRFYEPSGFWERLLASLKNGSATWVYSFGMYHTLNVLNAWTKFLRRELVLADRDTTLEPDGRPPSVWNGFCVLSDPPNILICRPPDIAATIRFLDPQNYGISDWVSLAKAAGMYVPRSCDGAGSTDPDEWTADQRAECVERWLISYIKLIQREKLGTLQCTAGSQAMFGWRRSYLTDKILIHDHEPSLKLERASYYGGRCECKRLGEVYQHESLYHEWIGSAITTRGLALDGPIYQYDINSAYSWAGSSDRIPVRLVCNIPNPSETLVADLRDRYSVTVACDISTDKPYYPFRRADSGEIVYPIGRFSTVLSDPEYRMAIRLGHCISVTEVAGYEVSQPFATFFRHLYDIRKSYRENNETGMEEIIKRIAVSLVGKLVQTQKTWIDVPGFRSQYRFGQWYGLHPDTGRVTQWRTFADKTQYLTESGEHHESMPSIAAFITSMIRVRLIELMEVCGHDNVYYYDTDSIWTNREGSDRLLSAGEVDRNVLGKLKLAGRYRSVKFYGIKHYEADGELKCAGLSRGPIKVRDGKATIVEARDLGAFLWSKQEPQPLITVREPRVGKEYRHGVVARDGTVLPFVLPFQEVTSGHCET